jgi:hypothetical protein
MQQYIEHCMDCKSVCLETAAHHLQRGGREAQVEFVRLLLDCAEFFQMSANFMLRESPLHKHAYAVCAAVCQQCAEDCEEMGDDIQIKYCAEVCRRLADTCQRMMAVA